MKQHVTKRKPNEGFVTRMCSAASVAAMTAVWLASAAGAFAAEPPAQAPRPPQGKSLPAGVRVAHGGNSWYSEDSGPLCQAAGITGHQKIRPAGTNTMEKLTPLLEKGEIDVFVWGQTNTGADMGMGKLLPVLLELGPKHNPNFRIQVQMPWLVHDGRQGVKSPEEYEKTDLAELQVKLDKSRKQQEAWADEINAKAGKRIVCLVPMADGMLELRKMIVAGKFPGVTKQSGPISDPPRPGMPSSVLRGDIMPHQGALAGCLGQYMHFAAMYRMSPEGLAVENGFNAEQNKILQKMAWDMVSKYPYAGVTPESFVPAPKATNETPAGKTGDGKNAGGKEQPAAVPPITTRPLAGWTLTRETPDARIVTDYNAYIEKLPAAERPGVADYDGNHFVASPPRPSGAPRQDPEGRERLRRWWERDRVFLSHSPTGD